MDNLRAGTVVLVFVYHVLYLFNVSGVLGGVGSFDEVQYQDAILYFVYPWFMLLLFALAGMAARYSLEKRSHWQFLSSRTQKLLVPSTLGLFVFQWMVGYLNMKNGGGLEQLSAALPQGIRGFVLYLVAVLSGTGPLWFAQLLWIYCLLLVLLQNYTDYAILGSFYTNAYAWVGTLAAVACGQAWLDRETGFSKWLVRKSWGIYVCHYLPLLVAAVWLNGSGLPAPAVYLLSALLGGAGTLILYEILRRIPVVKLLVLGE